MSDLIDALKELDRHIEELERLYVNGDKIITTSDAVKDRTRIIDALLNQPPKEPTP